MYLQPKTYKRKHFCDAIVILYEGQVKIAERSVASKYAINKILYICISMLFRGEMINHANNGSQN